MRYTFSAIVFKGAVYVVGGREYGDDKTAIYVECERYNFDTKDWQYTGPLNVARCTSNVFIVHDRLYVAGGYCRSSKRTDTIEVFREQKNRWELMGVMLPSPIEAAWFVTKDNDIFYCAGRTDSGDSKSKYHFRLERGDLEEVTKLVDELEHPLCLQKVVLVQDAYFIFGSVEFNKINAIAAKDFGNLKAVGSSIKPCLLEGDNSSIELGHEDFKASLEDALRSVAFTSHYVKRNAYVLPQYI